MAIDVFRFPFVSKDRGNVPEDVMEMIEDPMANEND